MTIFIWGSDGGYFGVKLGRKTFQEKLCTYEILNIQQLQSVTEKCGQILGTSSIYQNKEKKKNVHINIYLETVNL
jgi:hypothetical protein